MLLDLNETKNLVNQIVANPAAFPKLVAPNAVGAFFQSVDQHLSEDRAKTNLGLSGDQLEKLASVYPKRTLQNSQLMSRLTQTQKEKLQVAQIEASFVTVHFKQGFDLPEDQLLELERLTGREIGFGPDRVNIFAASEDILSKVKEFIGAENIEEVSEPQPEAAPETESAVDTEAGAKAEKEIARWIEGMASFGQRPDSAWADGNLLYSYKTVIAKRLGNKIYVNQTKYSATTSRLVGAVRNLAQQRGLQVIEKDEDFFGTQMMRKLTQEEIHQKAPSLKEGRPAAAVEAADDEHWNSADELLAGITYEELIMTVESNVGGKAAPEDFAREFENILQANLKDARHLLQQHMNDMVMEIEGAGGTESAAEPTPSDGGISEIVMAMTSDQIMGIVRKLAGAAVSQGLSDDPDAAQFDATEALYLWLSHNHEGQSSEEYEMLSAILDPHFFKPRASLNDAEDLTEAGQYLYNDMENLLPEVLGQEPEEEEPKPEPAAEPEAEPAESAADDVTERYPPPRTNDRSEHQKIYDAKKQAEEEKHLKTPEGEAERKKRNDEMQEKMTKSSDPEDTLTERLVELEAKRDAAHDAGDLRRADRYATMIEKLVEENEEDLEQGAA